MRKLFLLFVLLSSLFLHAQVVNNNDGNNPLASDEAIITSGRARFTVLTPEMIRIQYSARKLFEDRATFAVVNRNLPVPPFTTEEVDGYLYIKTAKLTLKYKVGSIISASYASPDNLSITFDMNGRSTIWYPGKDDALNLLGTSRTLDGDIGDTHRVSLEKGILSRDGWSVIDESPLTTRGDGSRTFAFDGDCDGVTWYAKSIDSSATDWYFMAYGHEYKKALGDYVKIAGRQPMPPLYMFGYWYSKYQAYTSAQFMSLVRDMETNDVPHDVMIFDMDWHNPGWTGWTWNKNLISNPKYLISWMHQHNLKVSLNLHPADGVDSDEDGFAAIKADMGDLATATNVPWSLENQTFYKSLFKNIIRVRESEGVDFWWLDWQQDLLCPRETGLGWTFWLNHVYYNDMRVNRPDRRPVIFHRWGGMGSHRYPIGFSGDTYSTYGTLAFEPYYTATASNVCFGYWGHDLGGHLLIGDGETVDSEMYLRWLQYGVFSPIFRTHGASQANNERRIWTFDNFDLMNKAVKLRYSLVPYIYTASREAYDTGVSICRPLYYEWPEDNRSYSNESEYMFGNDMLVAPIAKATDAGGKVNKKVWLPEGKWFDVCGNKLVDGNSEMENSYTMEQIPYFIRQGSVIPCNPDIDNLKSAVPQLLLKVIPGSDGKGVLYEDDGDSENYKNGAFSNTTFTQNYSKEVVNINIGARVGTYPGQIAERSYQVEFLASALPQSVMIDGVSTMDWTYDDTKHVLTVNIPTTSCDKELNVAVVYDATDIEQKLIIGSEVITYDVLGRQLPVTGKGINVVSGRKYIKN